MQAEPNDVIDWTSALESVGGDRSVLRALVDVVVEETPNMMEAVRRAVCSDDAPSLSLAAHTLKGSIRYFGETKAFKLALEMERMSDDVSLEGASQTLAALELEMKRFVPIVAELLDRADP
ncbi:MAG: Hpt domain-containing protein [Planctomycetota bacterium]|jgi:HPt (histidine-containing phosphotransfer) domain-containing protein